MESIELSTIWFNLYLASIFFNLRFSLISFSFSSIRLKYELNDDDNFDEVADKNVEIFPSWLECKVLLLYKKLNVINDKIK